MGKVIQEHYGAECTKHDLPCPILYNSAESYKCKFKNVCVCFKKNVLGQTYFIRGHIHLQHVNSWCAYCLKRRSHNTHFWLRYNDKG